MTIAIDCGSTQFRTLRRSDRGVMGRCLPALYCAVPHTPERRSALERLGLPLVIGDARIAVLGDDVSDLAALLQTPPRSLLESGDDSRDEFVFEPGIEAVLASCLPQAEFIGELCGFTAPHCPAARRVARMVHERGYRLVKIGQAHAVALAELGGDGFTGLGLSVGANSAELCLCHQGVEVARCEIPIGGQWIDEEISRENGSFFPSRGEAPLVNPTGARAWKESLTEPITHARGGDLELLANLYRNLLKDLFTDAAEQFSQSRRVHLTPQPVALIFSGGPTHVPGFTDLLEQTLLTTPFPVRIERICWARHGIYTAARGCLIAAELEATVSALAPSRAKLAS